jgi:hypothetical protein
MHDAPPTTTIVRFCQAQKIEDLERMVNAVIAQHSTMRVAAVEHARGWNNWWTREYSAMVVLEPRED